MARETATTEQLRHDIDSGRGADKVRHPDPAVAPLGTDEEAAGTPIDPDVIAATRVQERRRSPPKDAQRATLGERSGLLLWLAIVSTALLVALIAGFVV
jgi:hypothetical protein